jgi:DNA adenine methylase
MAKKRSPSGFIDWGDDADSKQITADEFSVEATLKSIPNPYVGNKRSIIPNISASLRNEGVEFGSVLDLFAGSGAVSLFMKLMGKRVISNDLLTSSYYNSLVFVANQSIGISLEDITFLRSHDNSEKTDFVRKNYADRFTPEEAEFLDNYRANIDTLATSKYASLRNRAIFRGACFIMIEHYIMDRCFIGGRLNRGQILAELEHRIAHQRNKGKEMKFALKAPRLFSGHETCAAYNMDALELLSDSKITTDLLYIDPPYGGQQSNYAEMFSFCEEYVHGAKLDSLPHIIYANKFVSKKDYKLHFTELLSRADRFPCWAISYNNSSWANEVELEEILKGFGRQVKVISIDYEYKYRAKENRSDSTEFLFIAR